MKNRNEYVYEDILYVGLIGRRDGNLQRNRRYKKCETKFKLYVLFCKIAQGFPELLVSNTVQVISCLSSLVLRVAGEALDSSSIADVEISPEAQTSRSTRDGLKG